MQDITWQDRLRYRMERSLSRGPTVLIWWLLGAALVLVLAGGLLLLAIGGLTPLEAFWTSLLRALDPGTLTQDSHWGLRLSALVVSLGGIVLISVLIGILSSALQNKIGELRKGLTPVIERDHLLILGWTDNLFAIVEQLSAAHAYVGARGRSCIVILAEKDKVEMEDALLARLRRSKKERIICRSGNPIDLHDLAMVNPSRAKAIIVLAPESVDADAEVIKTVLALAQMGGPPSQPIVAEIQEHKNLEVGRLAGGERVQLLSRRTLLARILAQTSLQPGLSQAYHELLDFNGEDVVFQAVPALTGRSFGDAQLCFDHCTLIGLRHGDGRTELNPPMSTGISGSDQVIVIARDEAHVELGQAAARLVNRSQIAAKPAEHERPRRRVLILGWNRNLPLIVRELDDYLARGSYILVAAQGMKVTSELKELAANLADCDLEFRACETTDRLGLEAVEPATFDSVIVLSYEIGNHEADARTLITLLHLREMEKDGNYFNITSEMQDEKNRALAAVTRVDDFIVSSRLTSLLLAQVAHNRDVGPVFDDFFDSLGSELYLKPVTRYVTPGPVHYATIVEAARHQDEVALGYMVGGQVKLNPSRLDSVTLGPEDRVLVLATS